MIVIMRPALRRAACAAIVLVSCSVREVPAGCAPLAPGRVLVTVDTRGIAAKRDDGSDLALEDLARAVAAKLRAAGIDAVTEYEVGRIEAESPTEQVVITLSGDAVFINYTGGGAYSGVDLKGTIQWRSPAKPEAAVPFDVEFQPPSSIYQGDYSSPASAPFEEATLLDLSFLQALVAVAESKVGRQQAYHAVIEPAGDRYDSDPLPTWEAFRQIHPDPVRWLSSQLDVRCFATRRRAGRLIEFANSYSGTELVPVTPELGVELDYYHEGHAGFLPPEQRHILKDALLVALETADEDAIRADAARTLGEIGAREALGPLRALHASLVDRIGSPLEAAVREALFQLDPPAWARPATYLLLLVAAVPIALTVVLLKRR